MSRRTVGPGLDGAEAPVGGGGSTPSARATFSRPPLATALARPAFGSTDCKSAFFTATGDAPAFFEKTRAAAPLTCGVAMEVPLRKACPPPGQALRMFVPGAARSTVVAP